ncbi:TetR/AcrR family transcriptional regulator [Brevibacterium sediminis]|uniref:TetR/AcrR family transcriptional regulator n=1 Tax=Brevibacterium sediminis TaxID=1857024 RepID=UPI002174D726|nr:helix-turn-helix domain-containing protein [Brevibacterium sediminis]MCS4592870.1 TetR/AcrR family transcriptional regulator [Brevibacterium sediminis]
MGNKNMGKSTGGIGRPPKLNRAVIVAAAIDIADRHGLDAVTMRAVAIELDSTAAALYRHVQNREELVDSIRDDVLAELPDVGATGQWRADLRVFAQGLLDLHVAHPWLTSGGLPAATGPRTSATVDTAMSLLAGHPAPIGQKYSAVAVLFELVSGFARSGAAAKEPSAEIASPADAVDNEQALAVILAAVTGVLDDAEVRSRSPQ